MIFQSFDMQRVIAEVRRRSERRVSRRGVAHSYGRRVDRRPTLSPAAVFLRLSPALLLSCSDAPTEPEPPPRPASIRVSPVSATLSALDATVQLTADVRDQTGNAMAGATIEWTSSADSVATVDATGLARAVGNGETIITASAETASGTAAITVRQVAATVSVSPATDTLVAGDTVRLSAEAFDENEHAVRGGVFSWSSSDSAVATVDTLGLVRAVNPGGADILATSGSATGRAAILVVMPAPTVIDVTPDTVELAALGDTVRLAAVVLDQFGQVVEEAAVSWSGSDESVATVDRSGLVKAVGEGATNVTASSGAASGSAAILVTQIVSSVAVTPATAAIAPDATLRLEAEAFDWNGRTVAAAEFSWTSSNPATATVDTTGLVVGTGDGVATITVQAGYARGTSRVAVGNPDRSTLAAFYNATDGPNWSRRDNWLTDAPLSEWYGVGVDGRGRVSHVNLKENSLGGRLPAELGHLAGLVNLDLRDNRLAGTIPPELGNLSKLESLYLGGNQLTGSIPPELGNLGELRSMNVRSNRLMGPIPGALGQLDRLRHLWLHRNELTGPIPRELGNLTSLSVLNLNYNQLTGPIPLELGKLDGLRFLLLNVNQITGSIPPHLAGLTDLRVMELAANSLTGAIPPELGKLSMLEVLNLNSNELMGPIPPELGKLSMLEVLNLNANELTGPIPPELGKLANLRELHLYSNELTGSIPPELGNLVGLQRLWLSFNRLTGLVPRSLVQLEELDQLIFDGNGGVCSPGTSTFVAWLGDIRAQAGPLCNESDKAGLIAFFEATGGDGWTRSEGWLGEGAVAEWHGVVADSLGHVRMLDLTRNGLEGRLPSTLADLDHLNTLRIEGNALSGQLPMGLAELPLKEFRYADTDLCVPPNASFQDWLDALTVHDGTGETCGSLSDRDILVALYGATVGSRWGISTKWLTDAPLDQWHGVSVDAQGRVDTLDLRYNNLTGAIPPELGGLANLRELDLSWNRIKGIIPPELGGLANLRVLRLNVTSLTGPIPPELAELANLDTLWLGWNDLTGTIPPELGTLKGLRDLRLDFNELSGGIPPELGSLASLRHLDLARNKLTGPIPPEIGNLRYLRELNLAGSRSGNRFSGPIPAELGNLQSLSRLSLAGNQLSGPIPSELGNLQNLDNLYLSANQLSGPIPPELGNLSKLSSLRLGSNRFSGPIPAELGNLGNLEELDLRETQLTGTVPPGLGGLTRLMHLQLSDNPGLSGPLPSDLVALTRIETLFMNRTGLCAPLESRFRTWLDGLANGYVPFCIAGERGASAYLTQATQSRTSGVPLVGGERALLRVFVAAGRATSLGIPPVRATFYLNGSEVHVAETPAQVTAIPIQVDEGDPTKSANAEIPGSVIRPGLEMVIEIDPARTVPNALGIARRIPETGRLQVDVRDMPELDLTLVPFLWSEAPDSSILSTVEAMAADPEGHELLRPTRTLLPVGDLRVKAHEPVTSSSNDAIELLSETQAIRIMEGATSHYMGMLPDDDRTGVIGVAFRPGRTSFSLARASTIAHELGHNMSLRHAPCNVTGPAHYPHRGGNIGVWGYDSFGGGRLVPPGTADLMSYCHPQWISDYHFAKALRFRLADEGPPAAGGVQDARPVRSLLLWGGASADSVPFLEPAFVVDAPAALPAAGGAYELLGQTEDGGVLFSLSFDIPDIADGEGRAAFAFALPVETSWARELASITLSGPGGTVTLDAGTDRPMTILRNSGSGQVTAFLRHAPPMALQGSAADIGILARERGLEALFSRGIPDAREWRR